ncbi:MAG: Gfo/Idh/MocA family oxidoreductase [Bifidobacteriaceae bacterium]|jgi:predicted dehydrogenase|nr:Gfo/Idh/MocA family oxidoreductase [Bifidobacteriaceae bacterium]
MRESVLRIGIVGAGIWGENHGRIYSAMDGCQVTAVCDRNGARASELAAKLGASECFDDYTEMFAQGSIDAVAIVTPDFAHADIAVAAAQAGKHMLIEKPLATTRDDVARMVEAITSAGVRAMVDLHNRWSPPFNTAHQILESGRLGDPYSAYFRLNDTRWVATDMLPWAAKSSILWFLGSHSLDTLRWFFNDEVARVYCTSRKGILASQGVDATDVYLTTLEFARGGIAQMENAWITPNGHPNINDIKFNLIGTKGSIAVDATNHNLIQLYTEEATTVPDVLVQNSVFGRPAGFAFESIRSFADCLISGAEFKVSLEDAANGSLAILAIKESAALRQPVEVRYL